MPSLPEPITRLLTALGRLPGIGPRSAERIALHLVEADPATVKELSEALVTAREEVGPCSRCGSLTEKQPCALCQANDRDAGLLCVVERPVDVITIEKSQTFRGRYHVLGGRISPLNGVEPEDLRIRELEQRLQEEPIQEAILALTSDVEGDATSYYLANLLREKGVKATRLAHGLPVGGGLEFADELTLGRAIEGRHEVQ